MELKFEVLRKPTDLTKEEAYSILKCAFPNLPNFDNEAKYSMTYQSNGKREVIEFSCPNTGHSIFIWHNYDIEVHSSLFKTKNIPLLPIVSCLITIGAIKIVDNLD